MFSFSQNCYEDAFEQPHHQCVCECLDVMSGMVVGMWRGEGALTWKFESQQHFI